MCGWLSVVRITAARALVVKFFAHRQFLAAGPDQQLQEMDACICRPAHCVWVKERSDLRPGEG